MTATWSTPAIRASTSSISRGALLVLAAEVAAAEPSVHHGQCAVLRSIEAPGEHVVAADDDLAQLADRQRFDLVVHLCPGDLHLDAPDRLTDRACPGAEVTAVLAG
jgi:hypothetical protein